MAAKGPNSFGIRDNHTRGKVANFLVPKIAADSRQVGNLFTGRGGRLTDAARQVKHANDIELITWLVIKASD